MSVRSATWAIGTYSSRRQLCIERSKAKAKEDGGVARPHLEVSFKCAQHAAAALSVAALAVRKRLDALLQVLHNPPLPQENAKRPIGVRSEHAKKTSGGRRAERRGFGRSVIWPHCKHTVDAVRAWRMEFR